MSNEIKRARTDSPIHELIATRYSPYAFEPRSVTEAELQSCLEAARWAASSFNEQPWSMIVARRDEPARFAELLSCLTEANQAWAQQAGALVLTVVCKRFRRNDKPNRVAEHDIGLAAASFTFQAAALGLAVHQMAGVDLEKARQLFQIPETHDPLTAIALGHSAAPHETSDDPLAARDRAPRSRKPLAEFVFAGEWGKPAEFLAE